MTDQSASLLALTIWQPWASLIIAGAKPYEFRGWQFPRSYIGRRIVIHAASRPTRRDEVCDLVNALERGCQAAASTCLKPKAAYALLQPLSWLGARDLASALPRGAGLGTAIIGQPRNGFDIAAEFGLAKVNDSDRDQHANWGWPLTDIERWDEPIPMRGAQGFWKWPTPETAGLA